MLKLNLQFFGDESLSAGAKAKISEYKKAYNDAKAKGDADGMSRANDGANQVRNSEGQSAQHANVDVANVMKANQSKNSGSGSHVGESLVNQYVEATKKARLSQLKNSYNNTINEIDKQEKNVKDMAQNNRNNASVQSQFANRKLANYLAENGLANSGTNAQAQINNTGALQNTLGSITSNEQNALTDYANQRVLAKKNLENDIASANAGVDSQALQMQIQYLNAMEQLKAQQDFQQQQALQSREWQVEDRDYNRDMNYIWDNNLGRYIDNNSYWNNYWNNNLSKYQQEQLNLQKAQQEFARQQALKSGNGSTSDNGNALSVKDEITLFMKYLENNPNATMEDFRTLYNPQSTLVSDDILNELRKTEEPTYFRKQNEKKSLSKEF